MVTLKQLQVAIARAEREHHDWQAELCEILLIPPVNKAWQRLNIRERRMMPMLTREADYRGRKGYVLRYGTVSYAWKADSRGRYRRTMVEPAYSQPWNSVQRSEADADSNPNYCPHSPSTAWDGIRRETFHQFALDLRAYAYGRFDPDGLQALRDVIAHGELSLDSELRDRIDRAHLWKAVERAESNRRYRETVASLGAAA